MKAYEHRSLELEYLIKAKASARKFFETHNFEYWEKYKNFTALANKHGGIYRACRSREITNQIKKWGGTV